MASITLHDKSFEIYLPEEKILQAVQRVARHINADYQDKTPLFLAVLNGAFMFSADLLKEITIPCEIAFIRVSSYEAMHSTGQVKEVIGLKENIKNRHVIILEDIVDTGYTIHALRQNLMAKEPASLEVTALLQKPDCLKHPLEVKYLCHTIPDDFVVGYGLDYNGLGRNLRDIYKVLP